jgi:hypothetical protein
MAKTNSLRDEVRAASGSSPPRRETYNERLNRKLAPERIRTIAAFLESHRDEFLNDPDDDSFWVHRRILDGLAKLLNRHKGQAIKSFDELKVFQPVIMFLQSPGQQELRLTNVPGIERIVFVKGDDVCICHLHPILPWWDD